MKNLILYGTLGGVAIAITAAALIKRKPALGGASQKMLIGPGAPIGSPKTYIAAKGDVPSKVAARFGTDFRALVRANGGHPPLIGSNIMKLPPGVADTGPRVGAQGVVR